MEAAERDQRTREPQTPNYVAVEGVIGAGKTSLAMRMADRIGGFGLLEIVEENPFLEEFYQDRRAFAFQTQIFFLLSRYRQQRALLQRDLFRGTVISDYMFEKDRIFANINLDDHELDMYNQIFGLMERELPKPERIVFLQASTDLLLERIARRGRAFERGMDPEYLETLNEAYAYFFAHLQGTPVLVINAGEVDFVEHPDLVGEVWQALLRAGAGTTLFRPDAPARD
ncbi:MAG: deoxynucleoside kinase [Candidatus Eisenbacteria bacterium]|nr:deoxynucleoside kinase [Candidatus Eisenbacteria bacterium]